MREVEYRRMFNGPGAYEHEELFVRDYFAETVSDVDAMEQLKARIENMYFELQLQRANERQAKLENVKKAEMEREQREKGRAAAIELHRERQRVLEQELSKIESKITEIQSESQEDSD